MASLTHYYGRARAGLLGISPHAAMELAEDWAVAALTGAALGAISAQAGGLDKKMGNFQVPLDGLAALAAGTAGLSMHNKQLQVASIAAVGSASTRIFEKMMHKTAAHGEIEDWAGGSPELGFGYAHRNRVGWGQESHDRLVEAAKYL